MKQYAVEADAAASALKSAVAAETQPQVINASFLKPRNRSEASPRSLNSMRPVAADGMPLASGGMAQGDEGPTNWGTYKTNQGFKVAETKQGDLNISLYSYARYLNQRALEPTYTSYFGVTTDLQQRQDFQLNKVQIKFLGWMMDPRFRYFLYAWTSNASQGEGAQVVLAGNLNYTFNKHFAIGAGIFSLPGVRSVEGNFPFWLGVVLQRELLVRLSGNRAARQPRRRRRHRPGTSDWQ